MQIFYLNSNFFLAVQDSSIGDLVSHSLTHWVTFWLQRLHDYHDYNDYNDYNDCNDYNDYNEYSDYNDYNDHNDYRDSDLDLG